jgi:5-hydroxyisourate hydrolase-like protein (transthyretin family)
MEEEFFMDGTTSEFDKKNMKSTDTLMSTEDSEIKDYEYNDESYTFEISEAEDVESKTKECMLNKKCQKLDNNNFENGEIIVTSVLDFGEHEYLQGIKINLYKINGLSPILFRSKITDEDGKVIFSELEEGCYRIIEIIDKRYFEKPKYINWNEIIIDSINKNQKVVVINKIKRFIGQDKHKQSI